MGLNLMKNTYYDLLNPLGFSFAFSSKDPALHGAIHINPPLVDL